MAQQSATTEPVARLAAALDGLMAERWDEHVTTYAWLAGETARSGGGDLGHGDLRVGCKWDEPVSVVGATTLGTARRLSGEPEEDELVRVTVAASCCQVALVMRRRDGRVEHTRQVEGRTVALLRSWASLRPCRGCAVRDSPSSAEHPVTTPSGTSRQPPISQAR